MRCLLLFACVPALALAQFSTELSPKTTAAFDQYLKTAEAQFTWKARYGGLRANEVRIEAGKGSGTTSVPDGLVHDWVAATLVPRTTTAKVLAVLQNYGAYKNVYAPDILDSRTISQQGNRWRVGLKLKAQKVITVILNSEYDVEYRQLDPARWAMTSRSTRIAELEGNRELPAGTGHGFLWRLNAYWLIEQRGDDVYLECRTLSLSRDVPFLVGPVVRPFVTGVPRESLQKTIDATVRALRENIAVAQ